MDIFDFLFYNNFEVIKYNYNNEINIKNIADSFHLDPLYFSKLFYKSVVFSPTEYRENHRKNRLTNP